MIAALAKHISELGSEDLQELVVKGWLENENVEFKCGLAARQGRKDPWYTGGPVGELAKERLFKEIVAFANRSGGRLFLGMPKRFAACWRFGTGADCGYGSLTSSVGSR